MNTTFTLHQAIIWCFCQEDHKPGYKTEFFWYVTHMTLLTSRKQQSTSVHALARGTPNDCILAWVRIDRQFGYESTSASGTNRLVVDTIDRRFGCESTGGSGTNRPAVWLRTDWARNNREYETTGNQYFGFDEHLQFISILLFLVCLVQNIGTRCKAFPDQSQNFGERGGKRNEKPASHSARDEGLVAG